MSARGFGIARLVSSATPRLMLERYAPRVRYRLREWAGHKPVRFVFLHIPKCAGSTLDFHFKANYGSQRSGRVVLLDSAEGSASDPGALERARRALFVSGHFGWNALAHVDSGAIRFTTLREPFERLRSLYLYARTLAPTNHGGFSALRASATRTAFPEFCLNDAPEARAMLDNAQARTLAGDYWPFAAADAGTLQHAKRNLEALDLSCDTANFDAMLPRIATLTGTEIVAGKTRLNPTRTAPETVEMTRKDFLSDRALAALIEHDVALYEHAQGLWAKT